MPFKELRMTRSNESRNQEYDLLNKEELSRMIDETVERKMLVTCWDDDRMLNEREAAEFLGVKRQTMSTWRMNGTGPAYSKFGRIVRYQLRNLRDYRDSCKAKR